MMDTTASRYDILKGSIDAGPEFKPRTIAELGVRESILEDIGLKTLYLYGPFSVADLSEQSRLSYDAAEQLFSRLRAKLLCEVTGMMGTVRSRIFPNIDGIRVLTHEGGCGGTRQDAQSLCGLLAGYIHHPNVAGATVLSLGCQNAQVSMLMSELRARDC